LQDILNSVQTQKTNT